MNRSILLATLSLSLFAANLLMSDECNSCSGSCSGSSCGAPKENYTSSNQYSYLREDGQSGGQHFSDGYTQRGYDNQYGPRYTQQYGQSNGQDFNRDGQYYNPQQNGQYNNQERNQYGHYSLNDSPYRSQFQPNQDIQVPGIYSHYSSDQNEQDRRAYGQMDHGQNDQGAAMSTNQMSNHSMTSQQNYQR